MSPATTRLAAPLLTALAIGVLTGPVAGQTRSEQPGGMPGLGGVRSEAPSVRPLGPVGSKPGDVTLPPATSTVTIVRPPVFTPRPPVFVPRDRFFTGSSFQHNPFQIRDGGGRPAVFTDGSGLTVNGSFTDPSFRLRFHQGSGLDGFGIVGDRFDGFGRFRRHHHTPFVTAPFFFSPWWYDSGARYSTIYGFYSPLDPNMLSSYVPAPAPSATLPAPVTENVTPSTQRDLGATYLAAGDPKAAATALRSWLVDHPTDAEAMRVLAVALAEMGQLSDASALMAMAYRTEPMLAGKPIDPGIFRTSVRAREDVRKASVYANRVKTASSWLLVAVLMQAEGRESVARPIVEKAKASGLESALAERLLAAMK
jgi:hypothetical protein